MHLFIVLLGADYNTKILKHSLCNMLRKKVLRRSPNPLLYAAIRKGFRTPWNREQDLENDLSTCTEPCLEGRFFSTFCNGWPFLLSLHVYPSATLVSMKDSGLRIRVERDLRERFLETCRQIDRPAAQVLREFMREFIAENDEAKPLDKAKRRAKS